MAKCPICTYSSRKNGGIYRHILSSQDAHHTTYAKNIKICSKCNGTFKTVQARIRHQITCYQNDRIVNAPNPTVSTILTTRSVGLILGDGDDHGRLRGEDFNSLDVCSSQAEDVPLVLNGGGRETNLIMTEHGPLSGELRIRMLREQFYFLGCREIPVTLLTYFQSQKRQRWDSSGEKVDRSDYRTPSYINRDLPRFIDVLIQTKHVRLRDEHPIKMLVFTSDTPTEFVLDEDAYRLGALQLANCWFPHQHEPLYGHKGRLLLPLVKTVTEYIQPLMEKKKLCDALQVEVAEMLLSASRFSDLTWKQRSIGLAVEIVSQLKDSYSLYVARWARQRQLCISNEPPDASAIFQPDDARSNAQLGGIILRRATIFMEQSMWRQALDALDSLTPFSNEASTQEKPVIQKKEFLIARIHHLKGHFLAAKDCYVKLACNMGRWETGDACLLTSRLADTHIELGELGYAVARCKGDLDLWDSQGWGERPKVYCIRISLADAWLQQDMFLEAEKIYHSVKASLTSQGKLPRNAEMNYIRILFGLARAAHNRCNWKQAYSCWREMMAIPAYDSWKGDFAELAICSSLSVVSNNLQYHDEAQRHATRAIELRKTPIVNQFWIPLLHKWVEDMLRIIQTPTN